MGYEKGGSVMNPDGEKKKMLWHKLEVCCDAVVVAVGVWLVPEGYGMQKDIVASVDQWERRRMPLMTVDDVVAVLVVDGYAEVALQIREIPKHLMTKKDCSCYCGQIQKDEDQQQLEGSFVAADAGAVVPRLFHSY